MARFKQQQHNDNDFRPNEDCKHIHIQLHMHRINHARKKHSTLLAFFICLSINSSAAIYFSRQSGNWNSTSTWSTTGYSGSAASSTPGSAAGDVVLISGYTVTVTATPANAINSITVSQNNNTGNDTKLYINTSGITLTCNSLALTDNSRSDHMDVEVAQGTLQVNGSASFTRSTSNNDDERLRLYVRNTGRVNITGNLTYTFNRADDNENAENEIQLDDNGRLDVTGNLNVTIGNSSGDNNLFDFEMNNSSICNVGGNVNLTVSNSDDGDYIICDLNGGTWTVTGDIIALTASSCTYYNEIYLYIDGATVYANDLSFTQSGGGSWAYMGILMNDNSSSTPALLSISGDLTYIDNNGYTMEIETNSNSTITVAQSCSATVASGANGDYFEFDFNGGTINFNDLIVTFDAGTSSSNYFYWDVDGATVNITEDVNMTQSGSAANGDMGLWLNYYSTSSTSTVNIGGDFNVTHTGGDDYEIEVNDNAALNISGSLTDNLQSSDGDDFYIDINGGVLTVNDNFNHIQTASGGTTEDLNIRIDGTGEFNIGGSVDIDHTVGGQISLYLNSNSGTSAEFDVTGNFTLDHGTAANGMYFETNDNSEFTVGGDFTVNNAASGGDLARFRMNDNSTFTVGNNLSMSVTAGSSAVEDQVEIDMDGGTLSVAGNLTLSGSGGDDAIITLDGTSVLNVTGTLQLNHTGGDLSYIYLGSSSGSPTANVGALTLTDNGGGVTSCRLSNSSIINVTGNINMSAAAASQVDIALYNTSQLRLGGGFVRNATPSRFGVLSCASGSTVEYNGSARQTIAGDAGSGGDAFSYGGIRLNNAAGFDMTTTEGNATIVSGGTLTFANGILYSQSSAFPIIASGGLVSGASNTSHVDGPIRKVGNTSFTFPIGDNGNYQPAAISAPSNATHHFTAQYIAADPGPTYNDNSLDGTINHISGCEYWIINRTNGASAVTVNLSWDAGSCGVSDLTALRVVQWDGSTWMDRGNGGTTGSTSSGTITTNTTITSYLSPDAPFTLASINGTNPLPVNISSFNAEAVHQKHVNVTWTTSSETDNDYFNVERSIDGKTFETIAQVKGAGNSNQLLQYNWLDENPYSGKSFYRLKQVDYNGNFSYSVSKAVVFNHTLEATSFSLYPNPCDGNTATITWMYNPKPVQVSIKFYDMKGQVVFGTEKWLSEGMNSFVLAFDKKLESGMYMLTINQNDQYYHQLMMVK